MICHKDSFSCRPRTTLTGHSLFVSHDQACSYEERLVMGVKAPANVALGRHWASLWLFMSSPDDINNSLYLAFLSGTVQTSRETRCRPRTTLLPQLFCLFQNEKDIYVIFNGGVFSIQNGGQGPVGMRYTRRLWELESCMENLSRNANFRLAGKNADSSWVCLFYVVVARFS